MLKTRKFLIGSLVAIGLAGGALAEQAPSHGVSQEASQGGGSDGSGSKGGEDGGHGFGHRFGHGFGMGMWHHHHDDRNALVMPAEDRALTGPDVKKIAEAFLLWKGNRSWKVADVVENPDNTVSFVYASPKGDVIARFKMDRKTGHISRIA